MFAGRRAREIEGRSAAVGAYHGQIRYVTCIRRGNASHDFAVLDKRLAIEIHRLAIIVESGKEPGAEIGISSEMRECAHVCARSAAESSDNRQTLTFRV